jgi:cytochrome P450 family 6
MRFANINVRLGLAEILRKFRVEPSSKTQIPIVFEPSNFVNSPVGPIWCKLVKI